MTSSECSVRGWKPLKLVRETLIVHIKLSQFWKTTAKDRCREEGIVTHCYAIKGTR